MPESVICNTTPIFYLFQAGILEILRDLYRTVFAPQAVPCRVALCAVMPGNRDLRDERQPDSLQGDRRLGWRSTGTHVEQRVDTGKVSQRTAAGI